jgi:hypothetical protein
MSFNQNKIIAVSIFFLCLILAAVSVMHYGRRKERNGSIKTGEYVGPAYEIYDSFVPVIKLKNEKDYEFWYDFNRELDGTYELEGKNLILKTDLDFNIIFQIQKDGSLLLQTKIEECTREGDRYTYIKNSGY